MTQLTAQNTLAIVVDIQQRLIPVLHEAENFVNQNKKMITGLKALGVQIIVTEQYPKGLGATVPEIHELVADVPTFEKTQFSALIEPVSEILFAQNIENVILLGCETHVCMLQTALDLREKNFQVYVPQECVTSRALTNKNNGLAQIQAAGGVVSNIESVLFQLLGDAKHEAFKTISKLIQ